VLTKGAKKLIALLVAMVVLVVSGLAYAANGFPARTDAAASEGGDHRGIDDMPVVGGLDGLLGDAEDAEEQD
jgi:flagellar basal body-associated protein FliL